MRLAKAALLLGTFALTACSGTVKGTGASPDGGPTTSGIDPAPADGCAGADPCNAASTPVASEYDSLFTTPASATVTSTSLDGVWAGSMRFSKDDVRLVITPSAITIAVRCSSVSSSGLPLMTIGLTVNAVTSTTSIRMLEGKGVAFKSCAINVRPQTFARCSTGTGSTTCFDLTESGLDFGPNQLFSGDAVDHPTPSFSKMSDGT